MTKVVSRRPRRWASIPAIQDPYFSNDHQPLKRKRPTVSVFSFVLMMAMFGMVTKQGRELETLRRQKIALEKATALLASQPQTSSAQDTGDSYEVETNTELIDPGEEYYLFGKTDYRFQREYHDFDTYQDIEREIPRKIRLDNDTTWVLPYKALHPTRNHDSIILENKKKQLLINVLGRHSRYVQAIDLTTGKQWAQTTPGNDPEGFPLNNLNHVYTVLVDSLDGKDKELWLPCGFNGDAVNEEKSIHYARILDLKTLEIRLGPKLPYPGGACVAQAIEVIPNEPPMICTFGGTIDSHDSGEFLPYSTCYDRQSKKWWYPFGKLPMAFDHGSISYVPSNTCNSGDPARLLILNFRTESYGTQRGEVMAFDLPSEGWTFRDIVRMKKEDPGNWYIYANITYNGREDVVNCPRDASGTVTASNGREILNYGGVHYDLDENDDRRWERFSVVRSFDVCDKKWSVVGDLGVKLFALQSVASQELQVTITCGGLSPWYGKHAKTRNSPWCIANRLGKDRTYQNRHGTPAFGDWF